MGPNSTRITREEIVTPPDFECLNSANHPAARVGGARIELITQGKETRLGTCYEQVPIRLLPPFVLDDEPASLLYLITLTAGLLDGDGHRIEILARQGTRTMVTGQSATRVHPARSGFATQQWDIKVEDDACLVVLPGPTIPYRGSRFHQRGRAELAPRARFIWGDIWLPGRYERGDLSERYEFERIVQDFEVRRSGRLIFRDRFRWDGPWSTDQVDWHVGGALASASLFIDGPMPKLTAENSPNLVRSVFPLDPEGCCVRWCGNPADVTADLVRTALSLAGEWTGGPGAPPWFLKSTGLAANHWFSSPCEDTNR